MTNSPGSTTVTFHMRPHDEAAGYERRLGDQRAFVTKIELSATFMAAASLAMGVGVWTIRATTKGWFSVWATNITLALVLTTLLLATLLLLTDGLQTPTYQEAQDAWAANGGINIKPPEDQPTVAWAQALQVACERNHESIQVLRSLWKFHLALFTVTAVTCTIAMWR